MRMSYFERLIGKFLCFTGILLLASCITNDKLDDTKNRTLLVYIGADNNLSNIANSNIYSMNSCISNGMDNYNLLVFVDRKDIAPVLLHVHNFRIDTIAKYPEMDSTDPMVLKEVIDCMVKDWPAEHYGLLMWSHGTGWIPTQQLHFVAPNMKYIRSRDGKPVYPIIHEGRRDPFAPFADTKAFAWEDRPGQNPKYSCMDLDGMVEAIPDGLFDYIAFDACYMGNVEIAYALRNKADNIISSCYEIVSYGFPYHVITRDLMNGNLIKTCNEFHAYYNSMTGWERMAGISLVKTDELDSLARCFRKVVDEYGDTIPNMDISRIQCFDRFDNHVFFDLEDLVEKMGTRKELMNEFRLQMERCVTFKITTDYIFPTDFDQIKIDNFCGLSVFIPLRRYEASGLNDEYRKTEWSINTGYGN